MNFNKYATDFAMTFVIVLVVSVIVSFLYDLVVHGIALVDWAFAICLALVLGIVLPWLKQREKN